MSRTPCGNKRRYRTEAEAIAHLVECIKSRMNGITRRKEASVYLCPRCSGWHLTEWLQTRGSDLLTEQQLATSVRTLQARWS